MTDDTCCKNCNHSKKLHKLVVEYTGRPKILPGTIMYYTHLESQIKCTQCTCVNRIPINNSKK